MAAYYKIGDLVYERERDWLGYISDITLHGNKDKNGKSYGFGNAYEVTWINPDHKDYIRNPVATYYEATVSSMRNAYIEEHENIKFE